MLREISTLSLSAKQQKCVWIASMCFHPPGNYLTSVVARRSASRQACCGGAWLLWGNGCVHTLFTANMSSLTDVANSNQSPQTPFKKCSILWAVDLHLQTCWSTFHNKFFNILTVLWVQQKSNIEFYLCLLVCHSDAKYSFAYETKKLDICLCLCVQTPFKNHFLLGATALRETSEFCENQSLTNSWFFGPCCKFGSC